MYRYLIGLFIFTLTVLIPPLFSQTLEKLQLSLSQCETLALEKNPLIKEAEYEVEKSLIQHREARGAGFLPKMELRNIWGLLPRARAQYTPTGVLTSPDTATGISDLRIFTEMEFSILQPLYTFGKIHHLQEAAESGIEVSEAGVTQREWEVRLEIRKLYWGIVLGKEVLTILHDAQSKIREAETKLNEKLDEGSEDVTQNDLFKLQIFKYEIDKETRKIEQDLLLGRKTLLTALGKNENLDFEPKSEYLEPIPFLPDSIQTYFSLAARYHPQLLQIQAGLNATRALVGVARSDLYPQFFIAGGLKYNYAPGRDDPRNPWVYNPTNFFRPGAVLGLSLNLNFSQTRNKIRLAENDYQKLSTQKILLHHKLNLEIQKLYQAILTAQQDIRESNKALKASENWLRSVSMSFDLGLAEIKELIDAYKANSKMQVEHLQNIYRYNVLVAELSKKIGYDLYPHHSE